MAKKLLEMSLEELWELFPIYLTEHKEYWKDWFAKERERLSAIFSKKQITGISHIGSTAVDTIWAKPIIDILVEIPAEYSITDMKDILSDNGYICMNEKEDRMTFNKGYTENGFAEKVFHLHLRYAGDNDELYFRDYLTDYPDIAREYEKIKLGLWKKYEHNRDGYTNAKSEFVAKYTEEAKILYKGRY